MERPLRKNLTVKQTEVAHGLAFKSGILQDYIFELNSSHTRLRFNEVCALEKALREHIERCRAYRREGVLV